MAQSRELNLRKEIIETCLGMNARGVNRGASGNVSARLEADRFLITPSGIPYAEMTPDQIRLMDLSGASLDPSECALKPSSEWRIHCDLLRGRQEAGAVLHAHPPFSTALACLGKEIPAFHYMVAVAGGTTIRCAPYATFGSQTLSDHALAALTDRRACLLANHGLICLGRDLKHVLDLAAEVETLAEQYWRALQIGEPRLLSDAQMEEVLAKFQNYGGGRYSRPS